VLSVFVFFSTFRTRTVFVNSVAIGYYWPPLKYCNALLNVATSSVLFSLPCRLTARILVSWIPIPDQISLFDPSRLHPMKRKFVSPPVCVSVCVSSYVWVYLRGQYEIFTATCFSNVAVMGSLGVRPSVCLSVCDVGGL